MRTKPPNDFKSLTKLLELDTIVSCPNSKIDKYQFIQKTGYNLRYKYLTKQEKSLVIKYLLKVTGYKSAQVKRLVIRSTREKFLVPKTTRNRTSFNNTYSNADIALLATLDRLLLFPNGDSLSVNCKHALKKDGDLRFIKLSKISKSTIYRYRKTYRYRNISKQYTKTNSKHGSTIGMRQKPHPNNTPGFIRVDTVHSGKVEGDKGGYFINFCDELTQWEVVLYVETLSENHILPILETALNLYPYKIINFHSDNGSEFINKIVCKMLNKLNIDQTKSRARRHNDNALIESKNGFVVRKNFGYYFIPGKYAEEMNKFLNTYFNKYLNYYRVCLYSTDKTDIKGKIKKAYKIKQTPFDRLRKLDKDNKYLNENLSYDLLLQTNRAKNIMEFMRELGEAKQNLYSKIKREVKIQV